MQNLYQIKENNIEKDLENIIDSDIRNKLDNIFNMYKSMNHDEINIIYKVDNDDNEIKIFWHDFVERNRNKCKIIYEDKEEELKEYMKVNTS